VNAQTGAFVRFVKALNDGLSMVTSIASNGKDVWATSIGTSATTGNSVSEFAVDSGALVTVLSGAKYGFNNPFAITYIGGRIWVANNGTNSMTEIAAG
jgi:hypothetical protein